MDGVLAERKNQNIAVSRFFPGDEVGEGQKMVFHSRAFGIC
jgi:hypothetical protein